MSLGDYLFSEKQLFHSLPALVRELMERLELGLEDVYGHREFTRYKTCPNFDAKGVLERVL